MDIPRLLAMKSYWADNPPLHLMVKAYLGIGSSSKPRQEDKGDLAELIGMIPQTAGA